jgi:hypothetical protein
MCFEKMQTAMVTIENYEEYLMMAADGELDAAAQAALGFFLEEHPELVGEAAVWHSLRLQPDADVVFKEKEALLRREPKRIAVGWRVGLAVAASILFAVMLLSRRTHQDVPHIVHNMPDQPMAIAAETVGKLGPEKTLPRAIQKHHAMKRPAGIIEESQPLMRDREDLAALSGNPVVGFETSPLRPVISTMPALAAEAIPALTEDAKASGERSWPFIRLAAANAPAVELVKEGMDARVAQISNTVKTIRETAIAVRIGDRNHYLNF